MLLPCAPSARQAQQILPLAKEPLHLPHCHTWRCPSAPPSPRLPQEMTLMFPYPSYFWDLHNWQRCAPRNVWKEKSPVAAPQGAQLRSLTLSERAHLSELQSEQVKLPHLTSSHTFTCPHTLSSNNGDSFLTSCYWSIQNTLSELGERF